MTALAKKRKSVRTTKARAVANGESSQVQRGYRSRLASELTDLVKDGLELRKQILDNNVEDVITSGFTREYQDWYTKSLAVVKVMAPERLAEFKEHYERDPRRKMLNVETYVLQDFVQALGPTRDELGNLPWETKECAFTRFNTQFDILFALSSRFASSLSNIRGVIQADLFDSELDACRELASNGHHRAAGAVAGVVLEAHLKELCGRKGLKLRKKSPAISDFNDLLKENGVLDVPNWRWVMRLADIRNLCTHKKNRDPTANEVSELIDGADKVTKTLN